MSEFGKGMLLGALCGILGWNTGEYFAGTKKIPNVDIVQQGYVVPSKLEIKLQDLDGNGKPEVLLNYDGREYILTLDSRGKPRIQLYEVKVVPK